MKAAILTNWKQIEISEIAAPTAGPGEVLINVGCAGICGSDVHIYKGTNPIAVTPVVPGHEFAGRIAALGANVTGLDMGCRVAVQPLRFCGACTPCKRGTPHVCEKLIVVGVNQNGGFAEHVVVPADCVFPIPDSLPDETAALAEPFSIATHSLRRGGITSSDRVLVIGAGPIGLYTALTARYLGARQVHISEPNPQRREVASSYGFACTDPTSTGAIESIRAISDGEGFDLVSETSGSEAGFDFAAEATSVQGRIVLLGFPHGGKAPINVTRAIIKELSLIGSRVCTRDQFRATLTMLNDLQQSGSVDLEALHTQPRPLAELERSILDVANGSESAKILIRPV
jgi:2-desacetyl-2-hydroxyethyl bacteriochlorophyllide A dehydrogenase